MWTTTFGYNQNIRFGCSQNNNISLQFKQPRLVTINTSTFCYHQTNNIWFQPKQPHFITTKPATFRPNKNNYILLRATGKHCLQSKQHHLEPTKTATCMRAVNRQRDSRGSHAAPFWFVSKCYCFGGTRFKMQQIEHRGWCRQMSLPTPAPFWFPSPLKSLYF